MSAVLTLKQEKQVQERVQAQLQEQLDIRTAGLLKIMKERFGEDVYQVLVEKQREMIYSYWSKKSQESGDSSIESFVRYSWESLPKDDFELSIEKTELGFRIVCTKCPHYDRAKRHGITEEMFYMYCINDEFNIEAFNSNIGFKRTKTLMQGHECCDQLYFYNDNEE